MKYIYTIEGSYPKSNNIYIGNQNSYHIYRNDKKKWETIIFAAIKSSQAPPLPIERSEVYLHYIFPDKRRRDADNYSGKMILDPLVKYGVIKDDSFKNISLFLSAEFETGESGLTITVIPKG